VISNLVSNAIKYSPQGGPIEIEVATAGQGTAVLAVSDRGIGIPAEHRDRVFERFYQVRPGDRVAGMGLGLYISRQIVARHGGHIQVEGAPGGGTRVVVTLPVEPTTREEGAGA
jgi:signal transduction histidine kinase